MAAGILTLTTDFGSEGPYVAAIKGVVLGLAPGTQLVDVSHSIAPQDIVGGSFVLGAIFEAFPPGTVHLAVVDPGVGTGRRLIAAMVDGRWLVLPDNGLIGGVLRDRELSGAWEIRNPALRRPVVAPTFHGRDILAPAAAHLLRGGDPADLGPTVAGLIRDPEPDPGEASGGIVGEVVFLDSFGNLITNIRRDRLGPDPVPGWEAEILGWSTGAMIGTYADRPSGDLVGLVGSTGRVEVAVVDGSASRKLGAGRGTPVLLRKIGRNPG